VQHLSRVSPSEGVGMGCGCGTRGAPRRANEYGVKKPRGKGIGVVKKGNWKEQDRRGVSRHLYTQDACGK